MSGSMHLRLTAEFYVYAQNATLEQIRDAFEQAIATGLPLPIPWPDNDETPIPTAVASFERIVSLRETT